jgi:phage FluMu gp28-like protein
MKLAPKQIPEPQLSPLAEILSVGKVVSVPEVLLGYQQRWVGIRAPLKVGEKSRRIGLTWAEAADNVLVAASSTQAGGMNVYYLGYNQDMTVEYIQACAMWARAFNYAAGEIEEGIWEDEDPDKHIKTYTITFPSGKRIVALTSRPSNLRGRQGVVVIDEAAFHSDLAELLKAALALLIWGGEVHVISTHDGVENPFNELIEEIRSGKRKGALFRCTFKEAVADGLYKRVCLRKGIAYDAAEEQAWVDDVYSFYGDAANEELDCIPSQGGGAYFSLALIEQRTSRETPALRLTYPQGYEVAAEYLRLAESHEWCERELLPLLQAIPADVHSYYGMDFARSGDLSVIWPLLKEQDLRKRTPFVIELRNVPFKQQEQILFYMVRRLPNFLKGAHDARGNGQQIAEAAAVEFGHNRIDQVMLTEGWYRDNMPGLKADLEDDTLYAIPADKDVVTDVRAFRVVKGVARIPDTRTTEKGGAKRHGDAGIALALADFASRQDVEIFEYHRVTPAAGHTRAIKSGAGWRHKKGIW